MLSLYTGLHLTFVFSWNVIDGNNQYLNHSCGGKKLAYFFLSSSSWKSFVKLFSEGSVSLQILVCVFKVFLGLFSKTC